MEDDVTPIKTRPERRQAEAFEDASLALREHLVWPIEDRLLGLGDQARGLLVGLAVVLTLGVGVGAYSLASSGSASGPVAAPVAVTAEDRKSVV